MKGLIIIKKLLISLSLIMMSSTAFNSLHANEVHAKSIKVSKQTKASLKKYKKGAPKHFKNCTAVKKYYPKGIAKGHISYYNKLDRDKDGLACEPAGWN